MPNRLASARSSYLRSAASQPVDWFPWGEEAFSKAKREDKPILLDIGAVWCHWCHVMDHESYEDAEVARLINDRFVAVKLDRDERPDVDARYQMAVSAITGQGGWPLTGFLTPEGRLFFGGTYFPPDGKWGRPGFKTVLSDVADYYAEKRENALADARRLSEALARHADAVRPGVLSPPLLDQASAAMLAHHDPVNGGFGHAPKFPHPSGVDFLLPRPEGREPALLTLSRMTHGGIHDHVGGGFHRYSTDAAWTIPHFEKMLYDNAALLSSYALAFRATNDPAFEATSRGIVGWMDGVLADRKRGGFGASQDADVGPEDDGSYFTWTQEELAAALDPTE
ncbi:MAG TPA: DUF255 domain-containing protein, partial [Candidatus Thermoplasmatota archaeon]|nr:DUF255 domain-containing protein [Candidatus Thermoplasmatota archaeon]